MAPGEQAIADVARESFGYQALRPGQADAIASVLDGRDTLAVMSTGSGKSAIYQIAGLMTEGATVVVSPLIALQRDQVEHLRQSVGGAAQLNSQVSAARREQALAELAGDALEFLFLAPEQLANDEVLDELRDADVSLLVVDEAHCISEWGHDFRPDYLRLAGFAHALGDPTILALTATAAPPVREEIVERLAMREPEVLVRGFNRANIHLAVQRHHDERSKLRALIERIEAADGAGIVYCATRRGAEELADALGDAGVSAAAYHAGRRASERSTIQQAFMDSELRVVCATTAFGMGVDKADVRWVFHLDVAESLDSYYQEVGRAGRDGEPAEAVLFYRSEDLGLRRFFATTGQVDLEDVATVAAAVQDADAPLEPTELKELTGLSQSKLATAVSRLSDVGALRTATDGRITTAPQAPSREAAVERAAGAELDRQDFDRSRVDMMRAYAETVGCRREHVLSYFGEPFDGPCGHCDNCDGGAVRADDLDAMPFPLGARVRHAAWQEGVVQRYEGDQMTVLFDQVGYKTLGVGLVVERGLLRAAG